MVLALVGLTTYTNLWGSDDHFPFAPFKMYSRTIDPDGVVRDTWAWAIDENGRDFRLSQAKTGIRRAEVEGQIRSFRRDPERLRILSDAYLDRHPGAPDVVQVQIRTREVQMRDGSPTGEERIVVRVEWNRDD